MTQPCREMSSLPIGVKKTILWRIGILRRYLRLVWNQAIACWVGNSVRYRQLLHKNTMSNSSPPHPSTVTEGDFPANKIPSIHRISESSSDLVPLKISLLGDCQIGKTSFLEKYVGRDQNNEEEEGYASAGLYQMDKTLSVGGARISYSIWEVGGDDSSQNVIPVACTDSVAMLFMFDLTSRCTLNNVIGWYQQARRWNQTAIPVLVGTKFDDFVQLPIDLQWTIASEARAFAKLLNATLFFSSATYNINVNKIFKFITAKLFNLPWTVERNLTIGEPIIDF
ncbi:hypothetical protein M9H77_19993 [Catharanthus roseus]|uniref:Uncharacterized protein n=1 Tax=Catharanthus roseus TaxID=4058 RepID=A0ACC0AII7_CATRO|nr:hypothetical protein M9H77_19993 [Catharanthus roseus]